MFKKYHICMNGCKMPVYKSLIHNSDGSYSYGIQKHPFCPKCGALMPESYKKLKSFFEVYNLHPLLSNSLKLLLKSEYESSVRDAIVTLENYLRYKSGLDLHGKDLASKALAFKHEGKTITATPLIAINSLKNESDFNEQEGFQLMLMGFFAAPRNLYQHQHIKTNVSSSITLLLTVSLFLNIIDGHSLTKGGKWIKKKTKIDDILNNMPNKIQRLCFIRDLKRHKI